MRQIRHPDLEEITLSGVLGALSDPVRLSIVSELAGTDGERAWADFDVEVCPSTLSHHMKALRMAGVIEHRKDGTRCFVSIRPDLDHRFPGLLGCILGFAAGRSASDPGHGSRGERAVPKKIP